MESLLYYKAFNGRSKGVVNWPSRANPRLQMPPFRACALHIFPSSQAGWLEEAWAITSSKKYKVRQIRPKRTAQRPRSSSHQSLRWRAAEVSRAATQPTQSRGEEQKPSHLQGIHRPWLIYLEFWFWPDIINHHQLWVQIWHSVFHFCINKSLNMNTPVSWWSVRLLLLFLSKSD